MGAFTKRVLSADTRVGAHLVLMNIPAIRTMYVRIRPGLAARRVGRTTDLLIEGYPRSANTFALASLTVANPPEISIASHQHSPLTLLDAQRLGTPALVLLREPGSAAASFVQQSQGLTLDLALKYYTWFYKKVLSCRYEYVLATFEAVTGLEAGPIDTLNRRFGTAFRFANTPELLAAANDMVVRLDRLQNRGTFNPFTVALPSSRRKPISSILGDLSPKQASLLDDARRQYLRALGDPRCTTQ